MPLLNGKTCLNICCHICPKMLLTSYTGIERPYTKFRNAFENYCEQQGDDYAFPSVALEWYNSTCDFKAVAAEMLGEVAPFW